MKKIICLAFALAIASTTVFAQKLMVGAGRVEITPKESELQKPTDSIHGKLFMRAIYISDGSNSAILAAADAGAVHELDAAIAKSSAALGVPADNYFINGTHTHSGGTIGIDSGSPTHETIANALVEAARQAKATARPARVGFGKTQLDLNVNRDNYNQFQEWEQKANWDGPCDKDLSVISFLDEEDVPIAIYMNYAMHPVNFYMSGCVTADYPGEACTFLENYFDGKTVALFTQGASGDANPQLAYTQLFTAGPVKGALPEAKPRVAGSGNGGGNNNAELTGEALRLYKQNLERKFEYAHMLGTSVAFSTLKTMLYNIKYEESPKLSCDSDIINIPGRKRGGDMSRENVTPQFEDDADKQIRIGLCSIGEIKLVSVSGECYSEIAMRLKKESPSTKTLMTTVTYFPGHRFAETGYIYSNNASNHLTFQVIGSTIKPGYAENGIVNSALKMIRRVK